MKYTILKQFIPGNPQIYVAKLDPEDEEFTYEDLELAEAKLLELEGQHPGREFKIVTS